MEDMSAFRWILLLLGLLILGLIFMFGNRRSENSGKEKPSRGRSEKPANLIWDDDQTDHDLQRIGATIRIDDDDVPTAEPCSNTGAVTTRSGVEIDDVVSFYLMAHDDTPFSGNQILHAVTQLGFEYGDMRIFHYRENMADKQPWFSIANVFEPGWFDMEGLTTFQTRGIVMFMQVPNEHGTLRVFDAMVEKANQLSLVMGAQLLDGNRSSLTRQTINHIREQLVAVRQGCRA